MGQFQIDQRLKSGDDVSNHSRLPMTAYAGRGKRGNESILGGASADRFFGDGGNDFLRSGGGNDVIHGSRGHDTIEGNLNAHLERYFGSLKSECLDRMIFFREDSLRRAVTAYVEHYHRERNHQGLQNQVLEPGSEIGTSVGSIQCRERLGGMLKYYYRDAA